MTREELKDGLDRIVKGMLERYDNGYTRVEIMQATEDIDITEPGDTFVVHAQGTFHFSMRMDRDIDKDELRWRSRNTFEKSPAQKLIDDAIADLDEEGTKGGE